MPRGFNTYDEARLQGRLWTPAGNADLWLDSSDPTVFSFVTGVSEWRDKSSKGRNGTQATVANQPTVISGALNGLSLVRFDGVNDTIIVNFGAELRVRNFSHTWLMIRRGAGTGDIYKPAIACWDAGGADIGCYHYIKNSNLFGASYPHFPAFGNYDLSTGTAYANAVPVIMTFSAEGSVWRIMRNGVQEGSGTISSTNTAIDGIIIGGQFSPSRYSQNDYGDVVSFIGSTTQNDHQQKVAEGYLAHKWSLTANLPASHPFRNRPPLIGD